MRFAGLPPRGSGGGGCPEPQREMGDDWSRELTFRAPDGRISTLQIEITPRFQARVSQRAQCLDRLQARRCCRGVAAKRDADYGAERNCGEADAPADDGRRACRQAVGPDCGERRAKPDDAAEDREDAGFAEELEHDVPPLGADGLANADLARTLGHRDEHGVHDADASDEQGYGGDAHEK